MEATCAYFNFVGQHLYLKSSIMDFFMLLFIQQVPFGYSRKDVLLIGVGVTLLGVGLKSGLEVFFRCFSC